MVLSLALGKLVPALAVGVLLAAGRALPVLALISRSNSETEPGAIGALGERPGILRLVRVFCAVSLAAGTAAAVAGTVGARVIVPSAEDPSVAATDLAWQQPGLGGFLSRPGAAPLRLPGNDPAIGGSLVAWHVASLVTVADRATLMPVVQETAAGVQKLALSEHWLAYRRGLADGGTRLVVQSLPDRGARRLPRLVGRPRSADRTSPATPWSSTSRRDAGTGSRPSIWPPESTGAFVGAATSNCSTHHCSDHGCSMSGSHAAPSSFASAAFARAPTACCFLSPRSRAKTVDTSAVTRAKAGESPAPAVPDRRRRFSGRLLSRVASLT